MTHDATLDADAAHTSHSADAMFGAVYARLKAMAGRQLARGPRGATLDTTMLVHELYLRVHANRELAFEHDAQFFAYAAQAMRHLLADRARRAKVVSIEPMGDFEPSHVLVDEVSPERWCGGRQALKRLADAFDRLPDRCREVVWLRRVEELSQKDVALRLGISEKTVEKHIAKGMRLLAGQLFGGDGALRDDAPAVPERDDERQRAD